MCCGKGGDLLKWRKGNITHLICADIAETSVKQCQNRYNDMSKKQYTPLFSAEFLVYDCTRVYFLFMDFVKIFTNCQNKMFT
jgi:mRNA (guanine-N7-)-methyltransferase